MQATRTPHIGVNNVSQKVHTSYVDNFVNSQ